MNQTGGLARTVVLVVAALTNAGFILASPPAPQPIDLGLLVVSLIFVGVSLARPVVGDVAQVLLFCAVGLTPNTVAQTILIAFVAVVDLNMRRPAWLGIGAALLTTASFIVGFVEAGGSPLNGLSFGLATAFLAGVGMMLRGREESARDQAALASLRLLEQRQRIAREMHDVVAYGLSQIVLLSRVAGAKAVGDPVVVGEFQMISEAARASLAEVRSVISLLRSDATDGDDSSPEGVGERLESEIDSLRRDLAAKFHSQITVTGEISPLPPVIRFILSRTIRELAANAIRHADPTQPVTIDIRIAEGAVTVVSSNIDAPASQQRAFPKSGLGIEGMRQRVMGVGGRVSTDKKAGHWTTTVVIPWGGSLDD